MHTIDARLTDNAFHIASWDLCDVYLKDNQNFPWLVLIPRVPNELIEIHELSEKEQQLLMTETARASKGIKTLFEANKINVGALGNIVSQLHIHVIARFKNDAAWPHSLWQEGISGKAYSEDDAKRMCERLQNFQWGHVNSGNANP